MLKVYDPETLVINSTANSRDGQNSKIPTLGVLDPTSRRKTLSNTETRCENFFTQEQTLSWYPLSWTVRHANVNTRIHHHSRGENREYNHIRYSRFPQTKQNKNYPWNKTLDFTCSLISPPLNSNSVPILNPSWRTPIFYITLSSLVRGLDLAHVKSPSHTNTTSPTPWEVPVFDKTRTDTVHGSCRHPILIYYRLLLLHPTPPFFRNRLFGPITTYSLNSPWHSELISNHHLRPPGHTKSSLFFGISWYSGRL